MSGTDRPLAVEALNVSKSFVLGVTGARTLGEEVKRTLHKLRGRPDPLAPVGGDAIGRRQGNIFHALRDVSFQVHEGEVLGIIGRNGAGKSTLLKLLSRITVPTSGRIRVRGHMGTLLEVGTGFNPELTGRENIYLNAAILGMKRADIDVRLDDIIAFSGIKHHIDTPVKRYSSGMKVRLGFSVAAHLDPEILVIDEVLAVGDAEFQRKCLGKIKDVSSGGRTVLFVSHNMTAVRSLCSRVLWLEDGRVRMDGPTEDVVTAYLGTYRELPDSVEWSVADAPGNGSVRLRGVHLVADGRVEELTTKHDLRILVDIENITYDDGSFNVGLHVYNGDDVLVFSTTYREGASDHLHPGRHKLYCEIPGSLLNSGDHRVEVHCWAKAKHVFSVAETIAFEVHEPRRENAAWFGRAKGVVRPMLRWTSEAGA